MLIRNYIKEDINNINKLGRLLHNNYDFSLNDFSFCKVITEDNNIIGFVIYSVIYERAEIIDIVIEPKKRKKGYGIKLLNKIIDIIKEKNVDNITLEVNQNNIPAINLYKKVGFEICAERKNYYNGENGYLMKKDLR